MKRKGLIVALVIGVLLLVGVTTGALLIDPIVHTSTVKISSSALAVPTKLGEADLQFKGQLTLNKFEAPNPTGFTERVAFQFERFDAAMPWSSAFSDDIVISHIEIENPELTLEFIGGKSNLSVFLDNLKSDKPAEPSTSKKRFRITRFSMVGAKVNFKSDLLASGPKQFILPPIELHDIGKSNWATIEEILTIILRSLATSALQQGEGFLPEGIKQVLRTDVKKIQNQAVEEIQKQIDKRIKELPIPDPFRKQ
jgi:hypothetical protein